MPHLAIIQVCTLMTHSVMLECDSGIVSAIRPSVRPSVRHKSVPCKDKCWEDHTVLLSGIAGTPVFRPTFIPYEG